MKKCSASDVIWFNVAINIHLADCLSYLCFLADLVTYMYRQEKNVLYDTQIILRSVIRIMIIVNRHT